MKYMGRPKTLRNLKLIFVESHRWRNSDLSSSGEGVNFSVLTWPNGAFLISAFALSLIKSSLNDTVLNGILTFASIYSSLIIPVIIMVYDKYVQNPVSHLTEVQQRSRGAKDRVQIFKNFTSRFVFSALETVIIAVVIIILILLCKSCPINDLGDSLLNYRFGGLSEESLKLFVAVLCYEIFKVGFIFLLLKFLWFIFYSIGALGDFFKDGLAE